MPFLLLLFLTFACLPVKWPRPSEALGPADCALLTWAAMGLVAGVAALVAQELRRRLARDPSQRERLLQRYASFRLYHYLALFAVFGLALPQFGWGWAVRTTFTYRDSEVMLPGAELVILAPFLAGLVLSWVFYHSAERALREAATPGMFVRPFWGRWAYVRYQIRQNLALVLVPVGFFLLHQGLVRHFPDLEKDAWFRIGRLGLLGGAFVLMPWALRGVLGLRPLPPGPLRDRLLASARRLNFRCSDVLLWNTNGGAANAMIVGVAPFLRYVLLTDRLVAELTPDELEAVFGHEIGHVKHHHMLCYLGFLLLSVAVLGGVGELVYAVAKAHRPELAQLLQTYEDWADVSLFALLGAYIFVVFGFLSRRCERQADIYGCRAVSCGRPDCQAHDGEPVSPARVAGLCPTGIRTFVRALEKVARLNGISRRRPGWLQSWQHSSIACRVEFLETLLLDPTVEPRFQRRVALVKWALFLALSLLLLALGQTLGWDQLLPF
jgi:STE24 endopeptidase